MREVLALQSVQVDGRAGEDDGGEGGEVRVCAERGSEQLFGEGESGVSGWFRTRRGDFEGEASARSSEKMGE